MQVRKNALVVGDSFHSLVESYLLLREVGFKVCWTYNQMQATQLSLKFQKQAHRVADIICNKPEECKQDIDKQTSRCPKRGVGFYEM